MDYYVTALANLWPRLRRLQRFMTLEIALILLAASVWNIALTFLMFSAGATAHRLVLPSTFCGPYFLPSRARSGVGWLPGATSTLFSLPGHCCIGHPGPSGIAGLALPHPVLISYALFCRGLLLGAFRACWHFDRRSVTRPLHAKLNAQSERSRDLQLISALNALEPQRALETAWI
jgi:hypothetical protein